MRMVSAAALDGIRSRTCAIGVLKVPVEQYVKAPSELLFKILGTGFLVGELAVLTNRHVAEAVTRYVAKESWPNDRRHVAFMRPDGAAMDQLFHQIDGMVLIKTPRILDLALIYFRCASADPLASLPPVQIPEAFTSEVGDPVALYGYAHGEQLMKREFGEKELMYRFGPILQHGFISALAPYDHSGPVDRVLIDARTASGMSGSPVIIPSTGEVIAMHDAGVGETVAFGIPLSRGMVDALLAIPKGVPGDEGTAEAPRVGR